MESLRGKIIKSFLLSNKQLLTLTEKSKISTFRALKSSNTLFCDTKPQETSKDAVLPILLIMTFWLKFTFK